MTQQAPKYGEYATPDEQRRLAGLPPIETVEQFDGAAPVREPERPAPEVAPPAPARSRGDLLVTVALLAYGFVNVVSSAISYLDLPAVLDRTLDLIGAEGSFQNFASGRMWGGIAAVVMLVGYGVTVAIAARRLRRRARAWWVPLVGAVITTVIASICIAVPILGDPAFLESFRAATLPAP